MKPKITSHINPAGLLTQLTTGKKFDNLTFFCAHVGPSMNPTLCPKDLLEIKSYRQKTPSPGDVILFQPPQNDYYVVHRITRICSRGIQTRGDNNSQTDQWFLKPSDILGQVIAAHRGNASRKIASGLMGRFTRLFCQVRRNTLSLIIKTLRPLYWSFCSGGYLNRLIPVRIQPQVATFKIGPNTSHKLLLGKRVIGFYDEFHHQWQINRPCRFFIDESSLPTPPQILGP